MDDDYIDVNQVVLVTGGYDQTLKFWDALSGVCTRTVPFPESHINAISISRDKKLCAVASNPHIRLYDTNNSTPLHLLEGHKGNVISVGFQRDSKWLFSGGAEDKTIKIAIIKGTYLLLEN